jgi:cytochrome bd-type quinol oxidase subunit 2
MNLKKLKTGAVAAALMTMANAASAQNLGTIADGLRTQTTAVASLVTVVAFVLGVGIAIAGFLKFRAISQNPNDPSNKMSTAFMLIFVGAGLAALPSVMGSGIETIFGGSTATTNANTGFTSF